MSRSRRARFRNRGKRKEALVAEKELMWVRLSSTEPKVKVALDSPATFREFYHASYMPIMRSPPGIIVTDTTA